MAPDDPLREILAAVNTALASQTRVNAAITDAADAQLRSFDALFEFVKHLDRRVIELEIAAGLGAETEH
jgi:hypothetical protein